MNVSIVSLIKIVILPVILVHSQNSYSQQNSTYGAWELYQTYKIAENGDTLETERNEIELDDYIMWLDSNYIGFFKNYCGSFAIFIENDYSHDSIYWDQTRFGTKKTFELFATYHIQGESLILTTPLFLPTEKSGMDEAMDTLITRKPRVPSGEQEVQYFKKSERNFASPSDIFDVIQGDSCYEQIWVKNFELGYWFGKPDGCEDGEDNEYVVPEIIDLTELNRENFQWAGDTLKIKIDSIYHVFLLDRISSDYGNGQFGLELIPVGNCKVSSVSYGIKRE